MERVLEPELMDDEEQALAYAQADFHEPNSLFIDVFQEKIDEARGQVLDLGCGPAVLSLRFAKKFPDCVVYAVDGSRAMLAQAQKKMQEASDEKGRVVLIHDQIAEISLPRRHYQFIISNSLLHHLHDPLHFWNAVKMFAASNAWVFTMDLMRPSSQAKAGELVEKYSGASPEILKRDYLNSLMAAFSQDEIIGHLNQAGLNHFRTEIVSEQHIIAYGRM